jgi:hypothetical protein
MDNAAIAARRLVAQQLAGPPLPAVDQVVGSLGGVQAQDYDWAKWSIGLRLPQAGEATVQQAIAAGEVVRTWAFRGTLHLLAAADVGWLTALLAPAIVAGNSRRYRQLELDEDTLVRSGPLIASALAGGQRLTRAEIGRMLAAEGISVQGQRAPYLLQRAALDGLICHGPPRGREPTYVLLAEWAPPASSLDRDQALARLAQRYFRSHGPATLQDFAWWSGLPAGEARQGLAAARSSMLEVAAGGREMWAGQEEEVAAAPGFGEPSSPYDSLGASGVYLLPPFDEYLLGYKDRSAALAPDDAKRVNAGGGMPRAAVVVDGRVAGTWGRTTRNHRLRVTIELFQALGHPQQETLQAAVRRFGQFWGMPVEE